MKISPAKVNSSPLRFLVLQLGARMHYAVPVLLAKAGMLEHFYTDICGNIGFPKLIGDLVPKSVQPVALKRLLGRQLPPEISTEKVTTCSLTTIVSYLQKTRSQKNLIEETLKHKVLKDNFLNANAIYTNLINSDLDLVAKAREQGILIAFEAFISPEVPYILQKERDLVPGIEQQDPHQEIREGTERDRLKWSYSDLIIVPSEFVRDGIVRLGGDPNRIAIVPYGISQQWLSYQNQPQKGRILFVGTVGLRKGNHYLAEATRRLQQRSIQFKMRVIGPYSPEIVDRPEFQGPNYIGQIPRSEVKQEFIQADFFVLPTLCEGMATVHLEALACGLPVITTPNCGSVVRDGIDGFIVPIRDSQTLADRIEQLLTNRALRDRMSQNAKKRAKQFTWEQYGKNLLATFRRLEGD
jgi:glycosyltransferase involved in cell wall biosynthesis